ncbi:hypothetical protein TSOC_014561, partial [Tetrabaena socialis]
VDEFLRTVDDEPCVTIAGHSLGGACATICALDVARRSIKVRVRCVTFGAPPAGNESFCEEFRRRVPTSHRVVHPHDPAVYLDRLRIHRHAGQPVLLRSASVPARCTPHHIETYIRCLR